MDKITGVLSINDTVNLDTSITEFYEEELIPAPGNSGLIFQDKWLILKV